MLLFFFSFHVCVFVFLTLVLLNCQYKYIAVYLTLFFLLPQFFNQVLVMGKSSVSDLSEHVFDLIQELFAIDPMLLTSVMPQLEFKLKVNTHTQRHTQSTSAPHLRPQNISFCWCIAQNVNIDCCISNRLIICRVTLVVNGLNCQMLKLKTVHFALSQFYLSVVKSNNFLARSSVMLNYF